ncbi:AraC family transcriptional regulator [Piscinibacter terrae]|uniref:AraC family transcriptional regulator n=1 Tax=Piscinibacter terrae TaxID=2496871 RepID=A0A3N7HW02_9BURK|nr:AraC family transcriptional regulator [Albitalea terrae]RQP26504.1 AraC family transcriptional regulator [Albitalea terrae]
MNTPALSPALAPGRVATLQPIQAEVLPPTGRTREHPALRSHHLRRMEQVLDHIETHLSEDLGLEKLADLAAFSPFHFHRLFLAWTGETLKEFVRRRRLESAAGRLRHCPNEKVTAVSLNCGFASPEAFARAFREHFGMTPSQWRSGGWIGWRTPANDCWRTKHFRVEVKRIEAREVLYMRERGDYASHAHSLWLRFIPWVDSLGLGGQPLMSVGLDDPSITPASNCRMDACVELPQEWNDPGLRTMRRQLPAQWAACLKFDGPAADIGGGWEALLNEWLPGSSFRLGEGHFFERYDRREGAPGGERVSCELCMPVEPA